MLHLFQYGNQFSQVYALVRTNTQLSHVCRQCLIQYSSLTQHTFVDDKSKYQYLNTILMAVFSIAFSQSPSGQEVHDIAIALQRLVSHFTLRFFAKMPNFVDVLLKPLTSFTNGMIGQLSNPNADEWIVDCVSGLLTCWSYLSLSCDIQYDDSFKTQGAAFKSCCFEVFKTYVEIVLKRANTADDEDEEEESVMSERMECLATLARQDIIPSMTLLHAKFAERLTVLEQILNSQSQMKIDRLWNSFEILLQLCGFVIADFAEGETLCIPDCIQGLATQTGVFFQLMTTIMKFSELETMCIKSQKFHVCIVIIIFTILAVESTHFTNCVRIFEALLRILFIIRYYNL